MGVLSARTGAGTVPSARRSRVVGGTDVPRGHLEEVEERLDVAERLLKAHGTENRPILPGPVKSGERR